MFTALASQRAACSVTGGRNDCAVLCTALAVSPTSRVHTPLVHCICAIAEMTKDWDTVQDEIKELSFNQRKPLEEVKELMEQKYKFRAS